MGQGKPGISPEEIRRYERGGECSVAEAAEILGCSRMTVHRLVAARRLYAWKTSGGVKRSLWTLQVKDLKAREQAKAIKKASSAQPSQLSFLEILSHL